MTTCGDIKYCISIIIEVLVANVMIAMHGLVGYAWAGICGGDLIHERSCPDLMPVYIICGALMCLAADIIYVIRVIEWCSSPRFRYKKAKLYARDICKNQHEGSSEVTSVDLIIV